MSNWNSLVKISSFEVHQGNSVKLLLDEQILIKAESN